MKKIGEKRRWNKGFGCKIILAAICLTTASCAGKTEEADVSTGTLESSIQSTDETSDEAVTSGMSGTITSPARDSKFAETLISEEKVYTFEEILDLLNEQGFLWEAYYNDTGERITMYCEDGTEFMFLGSGDDDERAERDKKILVMLNDRFYKLGFQEGYPIDPDQPEVEYYPQTAEYYLSETELMAMSQTDLRIACHEIYARHGKRITEPFLQAVFNLKTWYEPKYDTADFESRRETLMNEYEKENVKAILAIQKKRGFVEDQEVDYQVPRSIVDGSNIDLDGDGTPEQILFDFIYAGPYYIAKEYMVMINWETPGDFLITGEIDQMPLAIYAASLDGTTTQLIMSGTMEDGKPRTDIYSYQGGRATLAGQIDAKNLEIMEDCFWAYQYNEQQTQLERAKYLYENGAVVETGVTESMEADENDNENGGDVDNRMRTLIDSFDFEHSRIGYAEVVAGLERIGVSWESELNSTRERMELTCEDGTKLILMPSGLPERELIMAGDRLSERGIKRVLIDEQVAGPGDFYYPQTAERLLTDRELGMMNQTELYIARNEIYARHGRRFTEPFLHSIFSRKSWYKPKYSGTEFADKVDLLFNQYEKDNVQLIVAAEKRLAEK